MHRILLLLTCLSLTARAQPIETVTVLGVTPIPERQVPARSVPGNHRVYEGEEDSLHALGTANVLSRTHGSAFLNEAQSNPLQPDLQLRGFTASPLLGLPQGLAIYQDGVRVNEPFGDTVNWALLPQNAIARMVVTPGSSPLHGLNALGGALALVTKNGFEHRGAAASVETGDFGRVKTEIHGGDALGERFAWFAAGAHFEEDGWRDFSPSRATQAFAKLQYRGDATTAAFSISHADTSLIGNGPAPEQLLDEDREAIFTRPDRTRNSLWMYTWSASRQLGSRTILDVVASHRRSDIDTLNGDDSPYEVCEPWVCDEEDEIVRDRAGAPIAFAPHVADATLNRTATLQRSNALSLQLSTDQMWLKSRHRLSIGATAENSCVRFRSSTELGSLDATRRAIGGGYLDAEADVGLRARLENRGLYAIDVIELLPQLSVTLAGRFDSTRLRLDDRLGEALDGRHRFARFNPAAGIVWRASAALDVYASIGEASRAPTPVELTCADEEAPCRLPNAFLSDPPLKQVISRTIEAGVRGYSDMLNWHVGAFRSINRNDILFISAGALTSQGYFDNVGRTRREGIELRLTGRALGERLRWFIDASIADYTFRDEFAAVSPNNPRAVDGEIVVQPGDRIPSVPRKMIKAGIDYAFASRWSIGADYSHASSQFLRGDEANLTAPLSGYGVLNLRAALRVFEDVELFAFVENVTNERYASFGVFGEADEVLGDEYDDTRFVSPGSPRAFWFGISIKR